MSKTKKYFEDLKAKVENDQLSFIEGLTITLAGAGISFVCQILIQIWEDFW